MTNDAGTLATALYAAAGDMLKEHPDLAPWRPPAGITPRLSDAELVTLATMQAIPGCTSEARWLRHARARLRHLFPYSLREDHDLHRRRAGSGLHCPHIWHRAIYGPRLVCDFGSENRKRAGQDHTSLANPRS
jgi:hypothetical protein